MIPTIVPSSVSRELHMADTWQTPCPRSVQRSCRQGKRPRNSSVDLHLRQAWPASQRTPLQPPARLRKPPRNGRGRQVRPRAPVRSQGLATGNELATKLCSAVIGTLSPSRIPSASAGSRPGQLSMRAAPIARPASAAPPTPEKPVPEGRPPTAAASIPVNLEAPRLHRIVSSSSSASVGLGGIYEDVTTKNVVYQMNSSRAAAEARRYNSQKGSL